MGKSKSSEFSQRQQRTAALARALSHPARIAILEIMRNREGCSCTELVERLPLSQSTVSQHLKAMKDSGIIYDDISEDGFFNSYRINEPVWREASLSIITLFAGKTVIG